MCDQAIYPSLIPVYLSGLFPTMMLSRWGFWIKGIVTVSALCINLIGEPRSPA
jgi:hypothetical protein